MRCRPRHLTMSWSVAKSPRVAEQCDVNIHSLTPLWFHVVLDVKSSQRFSFLPERSENPGKSLCRHYLRTNNVTPERNPVHWKRDWTFQQDSSPIHKAKTTQRWLKENVPE
ncbi:hypothetical protein TNCV_4634801 [Trichonephila clavipes]|nr:hypothetical protein TNCV_4634801 [Trichonephila clavipes]